ncbi:MAG: rRNA maturation RNase YbeY [Candidatus Staskawiczbacteria bacterium]|nr:rRNA maturation RNase YbeY [Candidatus Staskawiczbacteria bacterium]
MIEINNLAHFPADKRIFSTVAKKVLSGENRKKENLSLAFVSKEEIKKLNKKFRKKNKATDVLSFELSAQGGSALGGKDFLGEVVICPEVVKENGEEILEVFIHGILHLLGYDHEKSKKEALIMEQKQKKYLSEIK